MKTLRFVFCLMLALLPLASCEGVSFAADSGAVSEGFQTWAGKKIFLDRKIVVSTLTGNATLYPDSKQVQRMDPNGSNRNVTLPAVASCEGYEFFIINSASGANTLTVKNAGATTIVTIHQNCAAYVWCDKAVWYGFEFSAAATGVLTADGTTVGSTSQAQDFGSLGAKADTYAASTASTGVTLDTSGGAGIVSMKDNTTDAWSVKEGSNKYLEFNTNNGTESVVLANNGAAVTVKGALTTTDGVSSGTTRYVGGRAYSNTAASTAITNSNTEALFSTKYTLPANSLVAGSTIRVRYQGIATATHSTDTLTIKVYIGGLAGTALISGSAVDVADNNVFSGTFDIVVRDIGATGHIVGTGFFKDPAAAGSGTVKDAILASTAIDTTAAQDIGISATWSVTDVGNSCRLDVLTVEIR
jgi:hypothetical protein